MSREVSGSTFLLERLHLNRQLLVIPFLWGGGPKKDFLRLGKWKIKQRLTRLTFLILIQFAQKYAQTFLLSPPSPTPYFQEGEELLFIKLDLLRSYVISLLNVYLPGYGMNYVSDTVH